MFQITFLKAQFKLQPEKKSEHKPNLYRVNKSIYNLCFLQLLRLDLLAVFKSPYKLRSHSAKLK